MRKQDNKPKVYYTRFSDSDSMIPMDQATKDLYSEACKYELLLMKAEDELEKKQKQLLKEFEKTLKHKLSDYHKEVAKRRKAHKIAEDRYRASYHALVESGFCAPHTNQTKLTKEVHVWGFHGWSSKIENKYGQFFCVTDSVRAMLAEKSKRKTSLSLPSLGYFIVIHTTKSGKLGARWEYYTDKWKKEDKKK